MRRPDGNWRSAAKNGWAGARLQESGNEQSDDVGDFYHGVYRWAGRVFVRVADGIAGNGRFVGLGALAAVVSFLNELLGVVPGRSARGHGDSHKKSGNYHADQ